MDVGNVMFFYDPYVFQNRFKTGSVYLETGADFELECGEMYQ